MTKELAYPAQGDKTLCQSNLESRKAMCTVLFAILTLLTLF